MKTLRKFVPLGILVLAISAMGAKGCPTIPKLEDRIVELALGSSVTLPWLADGSINTYDDNGSIDLGDVDVLDLRQILDDAGVDPSDVKSIKVSGVSYRITRPEAGRTITNGTVTAQRGSGAVNSLITSFTADASAKTGWIAAPLSSAGINMLNGILTDALASAQSGTPIPNGVVNFHVSGTSNPGGVATDFDWEMKIDISIVGEFELKVLN